MEGIIMSSEPTTDGGETSAVVTYEVRSGVAMVSLNRPEFSNAQNSKMTYALDDDEVRVIILGGNGKHFCGGHDIGTPGRDIDTAFERRAVIWWDHTTR